MRLLANHDHGVALGPVDPAGLDTLYAFPDGRTVRANFVSTVDGSAVGQDGRSGSINTAPDRQTFGRQRALADVVLVGAGTARAEGYGPARLPIAVVSRAGRLPQSLEAPRRARTILVTCAASGRTPSEDVWVCGTDEVDLGATLDRLAEAGMPRVLCEGGPRLFASLLAGGLVDEVASTVSPLLVGGDGTRMTNGPFVDVPLELRHLLEEDGTLLALWRVRR